MRLEMEDGAEQGRGGRVASWGEVIRCSGMRAAKRTALNGQQQRLGIGFRKAAWDSTAFSIFCRLLPAHSSSLSFAIFADVAARFFAIFFFPWLGRNFQGRSLSAVSIRPDTR